MIYSRTLPYLLPQSLVAILLQLTDSNYKSIKIIIQTIIRTSKTLTRKKRMVRH